MECIGKLDKYVHLGHFIASDSSDMDGILRCRSTLVREQTMSFVSSVNYILKLLISYCYRLHGCVL